MNKKMKILQSFITVAVISLFVCIYLMKYFLLYQYLSRDDTNNITVSIVITNFIIIKQINAGTYLLFYNQISNGNNTKNNTDSSPAIKSPVSFLLGNFLCAYIIIIIFICICGLYKFAVTEVEMLSNGQRQRQCTRCGTDFESGEISDKETELVPRFIPLQILPEISEINVPNYHCTGVDDWNKY